LRKRFSLALFLFSILLFQPFFLPFSENSNVKALDDSIPEIGADYVWNTLGYTGDGTTVGIIDSGIDWRCADFWKPSGPSYDWLIFGSDWYVDLNDNGIGDVNENLTLFDFSWTPAGYTPEYDWLINDINSDGWDYGEDPIFAASGVGQPLTKLGECKVQKMWDQTTGNRWVNGVNLTYADPTGPSTERDYDGHGTNVAGIVAGGQINPTQRNYVGVAPDADLTIVRLGAGSESDVIDAIQYCVNQSVDIISMSLGFEYWQFWDGTDPVDQAVEWAYNQGVPCVVAAANRADDQQHWYNKSRIGDHIRFNVTQPRLGPWDDYIDFTILWRDSLLLNGINLTLHSPASGSVDLGLPSTPQNVTSWQTVNLGTYTVIWKEWVSSRDTVRVDIEIQGAITQASGDVGVWSFEITHMNAFHDALGQNILCVAYDGRDYDVEMLDHVTKSYTLTTPATADHAITVASYNTDVNPPHTVGNLSYFSSHGPRIDGERKVTIAAPGMFIYSAMSINADYGSGTGYIGWVGYAGTSQATPHVSGVIALMMEANTTLKGQPQDVHDILVANAYNDTFVNLFGPCPNDAWGYGKLNATAAVIDSITPGTMPIVEFTSAQFLIVSALLLILVNLIAIFHVKRKRKNPMVG